MKKYKVTSEMLSRCSKFAVATVLVAAPAPLLANHNMINNTATVAYELDGKSVELSSNTVSTRIWSTAIPGEVSFLRLGPGQEIVVAGGCDVGPDQTLSLTPAATVNPGETVIVVVRDVNRNEDDLVRETIEVVTRSGTDEVTLKLVETHADNGVFAGVLRTTASASADACTLTSPIGATLSAIYTQTDDFGGEPLQANVGVVGQIGDLMVEKIASVDQASSGDFIRYTVVVRNTTANAAMIGAEISDLLPAGLRYQAGSLVNDSGQLSEPTLSSDGRSMSAPIPLLPPGQSYTISYVTLVTPHAPLGTAVNAALVVTPNGFASNTAQAAVAIKGELFSQSATLIGRVTIGKCAAAKPAANVRVLLEDGTFVLTDADGEYHIENLRPGLHVAQIDRNSLPKGVTAAPCGNNTRSARGQSQFVDLRSGSLWRADFTLTGTPEVASPPSTAKPEPLSDAVAAGRRDDWIALADGTNKFLFPHVDHNPRSPALRVAIARGSRNSVKLVANGSPVDPMLLEKSDSKDGAAVDVWSGIPLVDGLNTITATILGPDGAIVQELTRQVSYTNTAATATLLPQNSKLVADGRTTPVLGVRITDAAGRPVRAGLTGKLTVSAPYQVHDETKLRREGRLVSGFTNTSQWRVLGDDGIAYIELAPTTQTGEVAIDLHLGERLTNSAPVLKRPLRAWLRPGQQEWVVVGFAAGSTGYTTLARQAETLGQSPQDTSINDGQVKLYAKGRIKGQWLLTLAYDSDKQSDQQRRQSILTTIDPDAYYTLYGDDTQQGYDAQSSRNLFLKIERAGFYALFGDYVTNLNDVELGRFNRTLTGAKTEYRSQKTSFTAFAALTDSRHQRRELQADGLTGPYQFPQNIALNTEHLVVETRDRQNSGRVLSTRTLTRFVDYDIDYDRGTITLRQPLASRDFDLNPQFLVIDYETRGQHSTRLVAGGRAAHSLTRNITVGGTAILNDDPNRTTLASVDAKVDIRPDTQGRIELAASRSTGSSKVAMGAIAEVAHQSEAVSAKAYLRQLDPGFGVDQQNVSDIGRRRIGADASITIAPRLLLNSSVYHLQNLETGAWRASARVEGQAAISRDTDLSGSLEHTRESGSDGEHDTTQLGGSVTRYFLDRRLSTFGSAAITINGDDTQATPTRFSYGGAFAVTSKVRLLARHEIATSGNLTTSNLRGGLELQPWAGSRVRADLGRQAIQENGERLFGAWGMAQTLQLSPKWTADLSVDGSHTIGGKLEADTVDPTQPPAIGGRHQSSLIESDYTSLSAALGYRSTNWSWTGRAEARLGDERRLGLTTSAIKQQSAGQTLGGTAALYTSRHRDGGQVDHADAAISFASRRPASRLSLLNKLELIYDRSQGDPRSNDFTSMRLVNNLAVNWTLVDSDHGRGLQLSAYYGSKYTIQNLGDRDYGGYADMATIELRQDITRWLDIGIQAGARHAWAAGVAQWSLGPTVGISPAKNTWLSLGYNVSGFEDRDFEGARSTIKGPWMAFRFKFDERTLGLARR